MSNKNMPWFKVYGEILSDRKITRICAITKQPKAVVVGVWTTLLAIASQSPERGRLLISDGMPLTFEEIAFEMGIDDESCKVLLDAFCANGMVCLEGDCFVIVHWDARQSSRDDSKERVRKYREKREALGLSVAPRYDTTAVLERDDNQCVYCGSRRNLCVDHVYPIEQGGTDHTNNLAAACKACSGGKVGRTPEQAGYKFLSSEAQARYESYLDTVLNMRNSVTVTGNESVTSVTPLESEEDKESTTKAAEDEKLLRREVVSIWENNINVGGPGSILTAMIVDVLGDIPGDTELKLKWFREAVGRAKGAGAPNWNYIKAILTSWIAKGEIDTLPPAKEDLGNKRRPYKSRERPQKESITFPPLPDAISLPDETPEEATWQKALAEIQGQVTPDTFAQCIAPIKAVERKNGTFNLAVPTVQAKELIEMPRVMDKYIRPALERIDSSIQKVEVIIQ